MIPCIKRILISFTVMILVTGCASPLIQMGESIPFDNLSMLSTDVSNRENVLSTLGAPIGSGKWKNKPADTMRDIWYYEYIQLEGDQIALQLLLVFFDG